MKDDNKVHAGDTLRDMAKDPKEALKKDHEQTKADMENVKDKVTHDKNEEEMDEGI